MADFEQNWDFFQFFQFLTVYPVFGKFYAQITRTDLLNLWIYFDFKNDQLFSKYARKVNLREYHFMRQSKLKVRANKQF